MSTEEAGRECDALVAETVMGWQRFPYLVKHEAANIANIAYCPPGVRVHVGRIEKVPGYSTDIAAAWLVVENMVARDGWKVDVQNRFAPTWACHVHFAAPDYRTVFECADSAPLAICKAALVACNPTRSFPISGTEE